MLISFKESCFGNNSKKTCKSPWLPPHGSGELVKTIFSANKEVK